MSDQELHKLRQRFFSRFRKEVLQWGGETIDTAWTYYPADLTASLTKPEAHSSTNETLSTDQAKLTPRLVVDRINLPHIACSSLDFIYSLGRDWWTGRARLKPDHHQEYIEAIVGFYGRYIGASGYAIVVEFSPEHAQNSDLNPKLWRVDARGEGVEIVFPKDESDVYSQLGAYLDLRQGWAWLIGESIRAEALVTAEVEPGYLIGARPGDPLSEEDPADREDPEIEEVFSRFDVERFDTLEFLNSDHSTQFSFESERFQHWLPNSLTDKLISGEHELFVLSQSQKFFEAIEDVAERRKIEVSLEEDEFRPLLTFKRGPMFLERDFSLPYMWTLHSGRQHHEGAVEFFRDDLERLFNASELFFKVKRRLEKAHGTDAFEIQILGGQELIIQDRSGAKAIRAQLSLLDWAADGLFNSTDGVDRFLTLIGWSADSLQWLTPNHSLDYCPLSNEEARLVKLIRPNWGEEDPRCIGVKLKDDLPKNLWGYYALKSPQYTVPVFWKSTDILERHFTQKTHQLLHITSERRVDDLEQPVQLLWGDELAGALLDERARETLRDRNALYAYAFTPDLLALSILPLSQKLCQDLAPYCEQMIAQFGPDRNWSLAWSLELK
ncbi:MAG: hypothetical protein CMH49_07455 [Myxococcales bacterium]|nr:hypothetical protein [Myxococcales bacterium]